MKQEILWTIHKLCKLCIVHGNVQYLGLQFIVRTWLSWTFLALRRARNDWSFEQCINHQSNKTQTQFTWARMNWCPMMMVPALCINRVRKHTKHACARAHTKYICLRLRHWNIETSHPHTHSPNNSCISEVCVAILPSSSSSPSLSFSFSPSQMKWAGWRWSHSWDRNTAVHHLSGLREYYTSAIMSMYTKYLSRIILGAQITFT